MRVANPLGLLAGDEVSGDLIGAELDDGIEQGDVDVLTTTRAVASLDGREKIKVRIPTKGIDQSGFEAGEIPKIPILEILP